MAKRKEKHQMIWDMFSLVTFSFWHWLGYAFTHGISIHTAKPFCLFPDIWGLNVLDINVDYLVYLVAQSCVCPWVADLRVYTEWDFPCSQQVHGQDSVVAGWRQVYLINSGILMSLIL